MCELVWKTTPGQCIGVCTYVQFRLYVRKEGVRIDPYMLSHGLQIKIAEVRCLVKVAGK